MLRTTLSRPSGNMTRPQSSLIGKRNYSSKKGLENFKIAKESYTLYNPPTSSESISTPNLQTEMTKEKCEETLRLMATIRRVEMAADQLYKQKLIRGFCHLYSGEEAVVAGMEAAATYEDHIITAYRDHGNQIGRGDKPEHVLAELLGRYMGSSKGKGGSMHLYNTENNFYGGNGIVGAQIPVGTGLGFALKYKQKENLKNCAYVMYGDGAANQGQCFEAFNMAALWKLPVVYVCENNRYGMGTSIERSSALSQYYKRGHYIPGIKVDGMDVMAVKEACAYGKDWAINHGPILLEMETYRYSGHSMSDPGTAYRDREEVQGVRSSRDPIEKFKKRLIENRLFAEEDLKKMEIEIKKQVNEAVAAAKKAEEPPIEELWKNTYYHDEIPVRGVESTQVYNSK
eukprot:gb/GECH01012301.1/.p1 GENE.gb/GECH01012301.1/~~gb/GECH01012301.1/.p1  ORF type:complete len:400 (+),score=86.16 gb/GECH01012301.1/:1-1200(+)